MQETYNKNIEPDDLDSLTKQQLLWKVASLQEKVKGIEKGIKLSHDDYIQVPTEIQKQIAGLKELFLDKIANLNQRLEDKTDEINKLKEEKFKRVYERFDLIEDKRLEQKADTSDEVKNAFAAAKELFAFQNKTSSEQATQQKSEFNATIKSLNEKIDDNKERLTRIEGIAAGALNTKVSQQSTGGYNAVIIGLIISTIIGIVAIIVSIMK